MKKKVALITGASGGIGSCIARRFAASGIATVLLGRNEEKLAKLQQELGEDTLVCAGDITDSSFLQQVIGQVESHFGALDILVNCAGAAQSQRFEEITEEDYDRIMALNVRAPFLLCQKALPLLRKSDCAEIINIASVVAHKGYSLQSVYAASKHALAGFTKSLANEVYKDGIRVHLISPGGVLTDMVRTSRPDLKPDGMTLPEEVADVAAFFIEHRNNAIIDEICIHRDGKEPFA
ncbi:MAG: SDR family oxidoreductase [Oscillospiraceae bacterium]|nr:SDR family oxidoreductase [Oscillospiraceae bacterium]